MGKGQLRQSDDFEQVTLLDDTDEQDDQDDGGDFDESMRLLQAHPGKSSEDKMMINVIKLALANKKREWSVPGEFTVAFAAIGGVGSVAMLMDGIFGESLRLKELVPRPKRHWATFVSTTMAGAYIEAIPGLSMIGSPVMAAVTAVVEKKGVAGVARSAGKALGASAIDTALGAVTSGAYSAAQLGTAWLASAGAIWLKAQFYKDTYRDSATLFASRANSLREIFNRTANLSKATRMEAKKKLDWLERQERKCLERGKFFETWALEAKRKFDDGIEELKSKLNMKQDPMKESLLGRGGRSDE